MKILLVNDFIEEIGGVEIYCHKLKKLLEMQGYNVRLIGGGYKRNIPIRFLSSVINFKFLRTIKNTIEEYDPDIVHVHSISANISPLFLFLLKKRKIPIVMTIHGFSHYICPQFWLLYKLKEPCKFGFSIRCIFVKCHSSMNILYRIASWVKMFIHRQMIKRCVDIYICPSAILAKYIRKSLNVNNVFTLSLFVETSKIYDKEETSYKNYSITEETKHLLFVGRLSKEKGLEHLICSMPLILKKFPNVKLHIVGEGKEFNNLLKKAHDKGVSKSVIFHGYLKHEELNTLYKKCDIFVLPSICAEAFSLVILEAMSMGKPVITTNFGGQAELVKSGYNGYTVAPRKTEEMADIILLLLSSEDLRKKMGHNSKVFSQKFNSKTHIEGIKKIYEYALKIKKEP